MGWMDVFVGGGARWLSSRMDGWLCLWRRQMVEQWDGWMAMLVEMPGGWTVGWMDVYVGGDGR